MFARFHMPNGERTVEMLIIITRKDLIIDLTGSTPVTLSVRH